MRICTVDTCGRLVRTRGLCGLHYARWKRHGDVHVCLPKRTPGPVFARFLRKVDKEGPVPVERLGPCWLWTGSCDSSGYGSFYVSGVTVSAHKYAYETNYGLVVPSDRQIDHLCRVRNCVNPTHMEVVTRQENFERGLGGAALLSGRLERIRRARERDCCKHGHPFTEKNTYINNVGSRVCRECKRLQTILQRATKRMSEQVAAVTDQVVQAVTGNGV